MRRYSSLMLLATLILVIGAGCQTKPPIQQKVPGDPLLSSKKPVEGRSSPSDATRDSVFNYPTPPPAPVDDADRGVRRVAAPTEGEGTPPQVRLGGPQSPDR